MVEIIFGKHKNPRIERQKHVLGEDHKMINRQIEIVDNRKIKITYNLMI